MKKLSIKFFLVGVSLVFGAGCLCTGANPNPGRNRTP